MRYEELVYQNWELGARSNNNSEKNFKQGNKKQFFLPRAQKIIRVFLTTREHAAISMHMKQLVKNKNFKPKVTTVKDKIK